MRKFVNSSLLISAAAAGAIALSAPSAFASTWTIHNPNGNNGPWSASLHTGTVAAFKDVTTNQPFNCTSSNVSGTAKDGTGLAGTALASITSGTFGGCSGNLGATGTATISSGNLNAVSYDGTSTTSGTITNINAALTINDLFGTCKATVAGAVDHVTYNNNGTLTITPDTTAALTISSATGSGCAGLINTGDKANFGATYGVTPILTITSP
jgi:hypothetical protein